MLSESGFSSCATGESSVGGVLRSRVGGDARYEDIALHAFAERVGREQHGAWEERRDVDDSVPLATLERRDVLVAIAPELLDVRVELRVRLAAVEQRHLVAARERRLDDRAPEEPRPAEDEEPHCSPSASSRRSTSCAVL